MTAVGFNAMGGRGCIGVTANIAPALCAKMQAASLAGDLETAISIQNKLAPLHEAIFVETSPAPVKYVMSILGLMEPDVRLPLVGPTPVLKERLRDILTELAITD